MISPENPVIPPENEVISQDFLAISPELFLVPVTRVLLAIGFPNYSQCKFSAKSNNF